MKRDTGSTFIAIPFMDRILQDRKLVDHIIPKLARATFKKHLPEVMKAFSLESLMQGNSGKAITRAISEDVTYISIGEQPPVSHHDDRNMALFLINLQSLNYEQELSKTAAQLLDKIKYEYKDDEETQTMIVTKYVVNHSAEVQAWENRRSVVLRQLADLGTDEKKYTGKRFGSIICLDVGELQKGMQSWREYYIAMYDYEVDPDMTESDDSKALPIS